MKISTVDFIFDFASPNAYLCHKVIPSIEAKTGVTFNYIHCLLGGIFKITNNQAPMISFANIQNKLEYESLEMQRFIDKYALSKFTMNSNFPITTVTLQRQGLVAEKQGCGAATTETSCSKACGRRMLIWVILKFFRIMSNSWG